MKITMTRVNTEQLEKIMKMWFTMSGAQMMMENESEPLSYSTWSSGAGKTTTYPNGLSYHTSYQSTKDDHHSHFMIRNKREKVDFQEYEKVPALAGYWTYVDNKGKKKSVHYIKNIYPATDSIMTYCGIRTMMKDLESCGQPGVMNCQNCTDIYNSVGVDQT